MCHCEESDSSTKQSKIRDCFVYGVYPEQGRNQSEYLLFVGNLKRDKGVIDLVEAYGQYAANGGQLPLKFIGAGDMMSTLNEKIKQLGLVEKISLLGAMPHEKAAGYMRQSACLILPSYHEGVPNVVLEAANCGVPVIATRVGGIPEVVVEGQTGLLINAGDVPALAQAICNFESKVPWDQAVILQKGQQFSWNKNLLALETILSNSLAGNG